VCPKVFGEKLRTRPPLQLPFKLFLIYSLVSEWEAKPLCPEIRAAAFKGLISYPNVGKQYM